MNKRQLLACVAGALALLGPAAAQAQTYPTKPVRLIVPFPPGGGTDAFARPLSKVLSASMGQSFVIDNRGGAGGTLGAEVAAKSAADGYTLLVGAVHHTIAVSMYPRLGYDLQKDLMPVTVLSYVPNVVVLNPQRVAARDYASFAQFVKANPGRLNYASAGNGTTHHLTVELWKTLTGSFAAHIPYRGAGPAMQDLLAGQVDFMFDGLGTSIQHIKSGRLGATRCVFRQALVRFARYSHARGSWREGLRCPNLVRRLGACRDASRYRDAASAGNRQSARGLGVEGNLG